MESLLVVFNIIEFWESFFQGAGIPDELVPQYAQAFSENRIKPDMLLDIDREMLADMGFGAMGDRFAIIRHATLINERVGNSPHSYKGLCSFFVHHRH